MVIDTHCASPAAGMTFAADSMRMADEGCRAFLNHDIALRNEILMR